MFLQLLTFAFCLAITFGNSTAKLNVLHIYSTDCVSHEPNELLLKEKELNEIVDVTEVILEEVYFKMN